MTKKELFKRMWIPLSKRLPPTDDSSLRILIWDQKTGQPATIRAQILVGQYNAREKVEESKINTKGAPGFWTEYWMFCYAPEEEQK